jgi:histidine kinase/DNA gyrase B/HSP90-like ATPase
MTRWSLRRRLGGTRDAKREDQPVTATPVTGQPSTTLPPPGQPAADQAPTGQPGSSAPVTGWFEPGWGRPGQPGWGRPSQSGPAQPGVSPNSPGESGSGQYGGIRLGNGQGGNGIAVLAPVQQPAPVQPPAPGQPPAPVRSAESILTATRDAGARLGQAETAEQPSGSAWPDICDQFALHLLVLAEQLRTSLDDLEADEGDPERLRRLYQVDHAITRMRRASRDLRTLAGRSEEELAGFTTSLLDVIRMSASAIERYTQVTIGRVTDLAVLGYAADDIASVMAALLDNATRYSPGTVTVSGHLLEDGGVMFRIEDTGIGIGADQVAALNAILAGPVPEVDERTGRHTGFPVVHRIARKHSISVRLAARPLQSNGTVAMVTLPPHLLCEVPPEEAPRRPASAAGSPPPQAPRPSAVSDLPHGKPTRPHHQPRWEPPELPDRDQPRPAGELPRRERASLRGDELRPQPQESGMVRTPEQQAAARRAFADEVSAFSLGIAEPPDSGDDTATEEEAKP